MSVVQRCPNCGTTQATSGECDACHEAQVGYFCANHTPGLWLSGPECPRCGARLGEAPPAGWVTGSAAVEAPRSPSPPPAPPAREPARLPTTRSLPPMASWRAPSDRSGAERRGETLPEPDGDDFAFVPPPTTMWRVLGAAARAYRVRERAAMTDEERLPVTRVASGCLLRFVLLLVLMFLAVSAAVILLGHALLQGF
jgi:hypothetical protein